MLAWGFGASLRPPPEDGGGVAVCVCPCLIEGDLPAIPEALDFRDFLVVRRSCCCSDRDSDTPGAVLGGVATASLRDDACGPVEDGNRLAESTDVRVAGSASRWLARVALSRVTPSVESRRFLPVWWATGLNGAKSWFRGTLPKTAPLRFPGVELNTEYSSANPGVQPEVSSK